MSPLHLIFYVVFIVEILDNLGWIWDKFFRVLVMLRDLEMEEYTNAKLGQKYPWRHPMQYLDNSGQKCPWMIWNKRTKTK